MKKKTAAEKYLDELVAAIRRAKATKNDQIVRNVHIVIEGASVKKGIPSMGLFMFKDGSTLDVENLIAMPAVKVVKKAKK